MTLPRFLTWRERLDHERRMALPQCLECGLRTTHKADCSKWEPTQPASYYSDLRQRQDYRASVRDLGCVCNDRMPPHAHGLTCPMYRTDEEWADHLHEESSAAETVGGVGGLAGGVEAPTDREAGLNSPRAPLAEDGR